jgi:hypothetical protein
VKIGDYVYNVRRQKHGIIIEEFEPTVDALGKLIAQVFTVAWDDGTVNVSGTGFLDLAARAV